MATASDENTKEFLYKVNLQLQNDLKQACSVIASKFGVICVVSCSGGGDRRCQADCK